MKDNILPHTKPRQGAAEGVGSYLNFKRAIEGHSEVLSMGVLCKHFLPCLFEQ